MKRKKRILESIFDLFLKKDILEFLHIDNLSAIKKILSLVSISSGQITRHNQLAKEVGIDTRTLKNYLEILEETFLLFGLKPYFTNKYKEVIKANKIYFYDTGVKNYFANNFDKVESRDEAGLMFENMVISEIIKQGKILDDFRFWRNKNKQEVDLIRIRNNKLLPVEIKYKKIIKKQDYSNLVTFMKEYKIDQGYLFNTGLNKKIEVKNKKIFLTNDLGDII